MADVPDLIGIAVGTFGGVLMALLVAGESRRKAVVTAALAAALFSATRVLWPDGRDVYDTAVPQWLRMLLGLGFTALVAIVLAIEFRSVVARRTRSRDTAGGTEDSQERLA